MENPIQMHDWGGFTPIFGNTSIDGFNGTKGPTQLKRTDAANFFRPDDEIHNLERCSVFEKEGK